MITTPLDWRLLRPDTSDLPAAFNLAESSEESIFFAVQPRLKTVLRQFYHPKNTRSLMLKTSESDEYYRWIKLACNFSRIASKHLLNGWDYQLEATGEYSLIVNNCATASFRQQDNVYQTDWIEHEQLFGCLKQTSYGWQPQPGLIHQANGGTLIIAVRTLLMQPLLWQRLKRFLSQGFFEWLSPNPEKALPVSLPPLPLTVKLVLCGDREALAEFSLQEPSFTESALYSEFEEQMLCQTTEQVEVWCQWVMTLAKQAEIPVPDSSFWPVLINAGCRYSEDQLRWPLCPQWLNRLLQDSFIVGGRLDGASLTASLSQRQWQQNYLPSTMLDAIITESPLLTTDGSAIGQINGLSVIEYPGHPITWGEPSRISCVVHFGDGEVMDVERKAELGGNLHAKGMLIIQAYLMFALALDQQLPFSASMVFEQSYSEIDGDSASLAELSVLVSALAAVPIDQQIAVTGSVDQFGQLQAVGGLNEKIEGFYRVCVARGLTGQQGVILPSSNQRQLALQQEVVDAVKEGNFHIWAVDHAEQVFPLLMAKTWEDDGDSLGLLSLIQQRITQASQTEDNRADNTRWFNWGKRR